MTTIFKNAKYIAFILIALVSLSACKDEDKAGDSYYGGVVMARVEPVESRVVTEWQEFTGRFQAMQQIDIRARVSGYLQEIKFTDGQIVQKDDVLFVIDQRPFEIALKSAKARFELANRGFKRAKGLWSSKAISEEDYDQRLQELQITTTALDEAKLNLEFTEVKAPFTGRISRNRVDVGSLISGGGGSATLLTTLVTISPIEFYFEGSEADLLEYIRARESGTSPKNRLEPHPVYLKLQDEETFTHKGVINFLDNQLSNDTSTIEARAIFENKDGIFKPGMFARMRSAWNEPAKMIVISPDVIGTELTRKYVYVLDQNSKAKRKYVTLGRLTDDGKQIVRKGLDENDRVIISNLHMVRPGSKVIPTEDQPENTIQEAE